jgi:hypothetical protein
MSNLPEDSEGTRITFLEQALGVTADKKKEFEIAVESAGAAPKELCVHMTLEVFHRRKTMLIAYYSGNLNPKALQFLADRFNTTPETLYKDFERRDNWEPFIWESIKAIADAKKIIDRLQLAREVALDLMNNPRVNGPTRVGAIGKYIECTKTEIELLQSTGELPKQIVPAVVVNQNNVTQVNSKTETKIMIDLSKMSEDDRKALLRAEEALTRAETAAGPQ